MAAAELALTGVGVVVVQDGGSTSKPFRPQPGPHADPHVRVGFDVFHVVGLSAVLGHDPKGVALEPFADRSAPRQTGTPAGRFQQRDADGHPEEQQDADQRIDEIALHASGNVQLEPWEPPRHEHVGRQNDRTNHGGDEALVGHGPGDPSRCGEDDRGEEETRSPTGGEGYALAVRIRWCLRCRSDRHGHPSESVRSVIVRLQ